MATNPSGQQSIDRELLAEFSVANESLSAEDAAVVAHTAGDLASLIPQSLWKTAVLICGAGVVLATVVHSLVSSDHETSLQHFDPVLCCQSISGLLFLVMRQMAFVIGRIRSQSQIDFGGRYRWWYWMSFCVLTLAVLLTTNLHVLVPSLLVSAAESVIGSVSAARRTLPLLPTVVVSVLVLGHVLPDMSRSRSSQGIFVAGLLTIVVRQMLLMSAEDGITKESAAILLTTAGYLGSASLLLHARFVAFVCNDPPSGGSVVTQVGPRATIATPPLISEDAESDATEPESCPEPVASGKRKKKPRRGRKAG